MSTLTIEQASELFRNEPTRYIDVGAGEVACRTIGTGPDVLFVHGWPVSGATFRQLLPHLVDHVTCHVIDFPSAGSSRFDEHTPMSIDQHITSVRRVVDELGLDSFAAVGHDSGGMIARYAFAGDDRLTSLGLINTEQPVGLSTRFKMFVGGRKLPGFGAALGWVAGHQRIRATKLLFGDAFVDSSLLDGEFDEFFLQPLHTSHEHLDASMRVLRTFEPQLVEGLGDVHANITCPVHLVWGVEDPFFPVEHARTMVDTFANARLTEITGAGLFSHEERPREVAAALLTTFLATP